MEQKKPKIDLKARLGKKSVSGPPGGQAIPPPVGIPKPPSMMGAMPGAMRPSSSPSAPPRVDAGDPYAAIEAHHAPRAAEPKAIKVEMSEEVVQAQKKGRARILVAVGIAAGIAGVIGFAFGSGYQRGEGAKVAIEGAQTLVKEVDAANNEARKLDEILGAAGEKLGQGESPAEEDSKLGEINVPVEGANLTGTGIGRFKPAVVTMLISFTNTAQEANDQKERLQSLLGGSRKGFEELLEQQKNPKIRWSVFVIPGPGGPWANMQLLPEPFLVKSDKWPGEFKIPDGKETHTLKRYDSGDPRGESPSIIPVAPQTETSVCPSTTIIRLRSELGEMQKILKGDQTPGRESTGLVDLGEALMDQLRKIGQPG
jgi:hypothetical protein